MQSQDMEKRKSYLKPDYLAANVIGECLLQDSGTEEVVIPVNPPGNPDQPIGVKAHNGLWGEEW